MLKRRSFLNNIIPFGIIFSMPQKLNGASKSAQVDGSNSDKNSLNVVVSYTATTLTSNLNQLFIAHRGVHLKNTIAPENSLVAIRLAARAGFRAVEFDVHETRDNHFVVLHDSTLNRTAIYKDGTPLEKEISISTLSLAEVKERFVLNCTNLENKSEIPTMQEFLMECKKHSVLPFVEIKPHDFDKSTYLRIIKEMDEIMGKRNYVVTSNNKACFDIRAMGIRDITLMGILYQTTFDKLKDLGNIIIAVSPTRFNLSEYKANIRKTNLAGLKTESSANNFKQFNWAYQMGVDILSTDSLAPGIEELKRLFQYKIYYRKSDFKSPKAGSNEIVSLKTDDTLSIKDDLSFVEFGGIYLEIDVKGSCEIKIGEETFNIQTEKFGFYKYQKMIYSSKPNFYLRATNDCHIRDIRVTIVNY